MIAKYILFFYPLVVLVVFLISLKMKRFKWLTNNNLKNGRMTNYLLLNFPAIILCLILVIITDGILNKIYIITSPLLYIGIASLTVNAINNKRIAKDVNKSNSAIFISSNEGDSN